MVEMGKWPALASLDIIGSLDMGYRFRARESASISGSGNTEESPAPSWHIYTIQSSIWESIR